jgi:intraflagellar transport protein 88
VSLKLNVPIGQLGKARGHYEDIIGTDALCAEAMYNLGLVMKIMNNVSGALPWFEKVHLAMPRNPEVIFQIADM